MISHYATHPARGTDAANETEADDGPRQEETEHKLPARQTHVVETLGDVQHIVTVNKGHVFSTNISDHLLRCSAMCPELY